MTDKLKGKGMLINDPWNQILKLDHSRNETRAANILGRKGISPQQAIDFSNTELIERTSGGSMGLTNNSIEHLNTLLIRFNKLKNENTHHFEQRMPI